MLELHLDRSRTARAFDPGESLWDDELKRIFKLIRRQCISLENMKNEPDEKKPLLSIAIFGTYGSGKTSLLKTCNHYLKESVTPSDEALKQDLSYLRTHVAVLPSLEPNNISRDDHFLYAFLATALEEDLRARERARGAPWHRGGEAGRPEAALERTETHILSPVQQAFQEVSEYLQVLDPSHRTQEYDPLGFSLERLERHTSGLRLRRRLGKLVRDLAYSLAGPSSVVLLPVDDVDMALENFIQTLDTYRRYLCHPQLVPIFTFSDRLGEELLRVHFARQLALGEVSGAKADGGLTGLRGLAHQLAFQYLVKLFPIRNRIRLGPAATRVQGAELVVPGEEVGKEEEKEKETKPVQQLLALSSRVLFGCSEWTSTPRIRAVLRPAALRRQIQVVDAMHASRMLDLEDAASGEVEAGADLAALEQARRVLPDWWFVFNQGAWSLLNVHRDALRSFDLHMEELYSWSRSGLRRHLLNTLLALPLTSRQQLIKPWRDRVEDHASQAISLLAAAAFRPRMFGEEPMGDDLEELAAYSEEQDRRAAGSGEPCRGIPALQAALWWLELWMGFYLPQILVSGLRDVDNEMARGQEGREVSPGELLSGWAWDVRSGPGNAMLRALERRAAAKSGQKGALDPGTEGTAGSGILFLEAEELRQGLELLAEEREEGENVVAGGEIDVMLHLWFQYGFHGGRAWAAVSLWRGLGLMGQILDGYLRFSSRRRPESESPSASGAGSNDSVDAEDEPTGESRSGSDGLQDWIRGLIAGSYENARLSGDRSQEEDIPNFPRPREHAKSPQEVIQDLARCLVGWLEEYASCWVRPQILEGQGPARASEHCFVRRLHGDLILGDLWRNIGRAELEPATSTAATGEEPSERKAALAQKGKSKGKDEDDTETRRASWNATTALAKWSESFERFFSGVGLFDGEGEAGELADLFVSCPLLNPWPKTPRATRRSRFYKNFVVGKSRRENLYRFFKLMKVVHGDDKAMEKEDDPPTGRGEQGSDASAS